MLIDALDIKHSGNVKSRVVHGPSQERFITEWATLLESVGWTLAETLFPTAAVTYPLGAPTTDGVTVLPKTVVGCSAYPGILSIGGQQFSLYDPYKQIPGTTMSCAFVQEGLTAEETLQNVVDVVNILGVWSAVLTFNGGVSWTISLRANAGGPLYNEVFVNGNAVSGSTTSYGGGYRMVSSGLSSSAVYECTMIAANRGGAGDDYLNGVLQFNFLINGVDREIHLLNDVQGTLGFMGALGVGAVPQYTVIANPYGFAVFDQPHDTSTHLFRQISLFCMAPYFPTTTDVPPSEIFVPAYAVFLMGPNAIGGSPAWRRGPATMSLDGPPFDTFSSNPTARLLSLRSPTLPLLTIYGVPLFLCAYVQFGSAGANTDPAWVVGKVWDCALVTDYIAAGAGLDGRDFLAIGGSDGSGDQSFVTFMMDAGTTGGHAPIGQSARCAAASGISNGDVGNSAR